MKYFDIHEMIEKSRLTQEIRVALGGICDLHNHLNDIRNMNEATYLCFVHLFVIDLQPHLESFLLLCRSVTACFLGYSRAAGKGLQLGRTYLWRG